jgi:hypothetical protein
MPLLKLKTRAPGVLSSNAEKCSETCRLLKVCDSSMDKLQFVCFKLNKTNTIKNNTIKLIIVSLLPKMMYALTIGWIRFYAIESIVIDVMF